MCMHVLTVGRGDAMRARGASGGGAEGGVGTSRRWAGHVGTEPSRCAWHGGGLKRAGRAQGSLAASQPARQQGQAARQARSHTRVCPER